jgi:hypothetical protein
MIPKKNEQTGYVPCELCAEEYAIDAVGGVTPDGRRGYFLVCPACKQIVLDERRKRRE